MVNTSNSSTHDIDIRMGLLYIIVLQNMFIYVATILLLHKILFCELTVDFFHFTKT